MNSIWNYPTRVRFGAGELNAVPEELRRLGVARPLIVSDPGIVKVGLTARLEELLAASGASSRTFSDVSENPTEANVGAGASAFGDHQADCIVGIGGGSPLDVAKLIAVRARVANPFEELDDEKGGDRLIPPDLVPIVAIPTTAGTGSEVGRAGVLTLESSGRKTVIFAPSMLPKVAILDPELSRSMPAKVTAATGFDALTHCLEAYVAPGDHPMADAIALSGIALAYRSLLRAVEHPDDLEARGDLLKAAMMGATAFQKGLGACHSLAHPLSSECGLHHGLANALCLPVVAAFNLPVCESRYLLVTRIMGGERAAQLPELLASYRSQIGITGTLSTFGVRPDQLERLADLAYADGCHRQNPRSCSREELLELYKAAL